MSGFGLAFRETFGIASSSYEPDEAAVFLQRELQREREARDRQMAEMEEQIGELIRSQPTVYVFRGLATIPELPPKPRGVYVAEFLSARGNYVLYAVDRHRHCVARVEVRNPARWGDYVQAIWQRLDVLDPIPVKLVP